MVAEHITNLPVTGKDNGPRARTQMLVVHSAETPLASGYAASVTRNWLNVAGVEASINAFAGPDTLVRAVHTDNAAWHATWANNVSVGYETTGYAAFTRAQWLTQAGKDMLDRLGREMAADANIYNIPIRWLTTAEVNKIAAGNTAIKGLATHRQIDPVNRTDPGDGFPYDVLLANIRKYAGGTTTGTTTTTTPAAKKVSELPSYKRLYPKPVTRELGKNTEWWLKAAGDDGKFRFNENYACNGLGHYDIDLFIQGTNLPAGETVTVQFYVIPTGGKRSGYFEQEIHGSADGTFKGTARFNYPILTAAKIEASVKASTTGVKLALYGAEVTTWAK